MELTNSHVLCLKSFRGEGPINGRVIVSLVMEGGAIDSLFRPTTFIMIALSVIIICMAVFFPLIHFDLSLQPIAVWDFYPKLLIYEFYHIYRCALHVNQLKFIGVIRVLTVNLTD